MFLWSVDYFYSRKATKSYSLLDNRECCRNTGLACNYSCQSCNNKYRPIYTSWRETRKKIKRTISCYWINNLHKTESQVWATKFLFGNILMAIVYAFPLWTKFCFSTKSCLFQNKHSKTVLSECWKPSQYLSRGRKTKLQKISFIPGMDL